MAPIRAESVFPIETKHPMCKKRIKVCEKQVRTVSSEVEGGFTHKTAKFLLNSSLLIEMFKHEVWNRPPTSRREKTHASFGISSEPIEFRTDKIKPRFHIEATLTQRDRSFRHSLFESLLFFCLLICTQRVPTRCSLKRERKSPSRPPIVRGWNMSIEIWPPLSTILS